MNIIGKTEDNIQLVDGIFNLFDRHGIPLEIILEKLKTSNMMPCWITFYKDANKAGWTHKTIMNRLGTAIGDVYGSNFWKEVKERLMLW